MHDKLRLYAARLYDYIFGGFWCGIASLLTKVTSQGVKTLANNWRIYGISNLVY